MPTVRPYAFGSFVFCWDNASEDGGGGRGGGKYWANVRDDPEGKKVKFIKTAGRMAA